MIILLNAFLISLSEEMQKVDEMKLNYTLPDGIVLSETEKAESVKCHRVLFEPTLSGKYILSKWRSL